MISKKILLVACAAVSFSLFSMQEEMKNMTMQTDDTENSIQGIEEDQIPQNIKMGYEKITKKPCWPYKICPEAYKDSACTNRRKWISGIAGGISGVITGCQLLECCLTWICLDRGTCKDAALCIFTGNEKVFYPTNYPYTYCDSRASICWAALSIGLTAINGAGIITSACAWNPCCNEKGCILCVKDEENNSLKTNSIELQGN